IPEQYVPADASPGRPSREPSPIASKKKRPGSAPGTNKFSGFSVCVFLRASGERSIGAVSEKGELPVMSVQHFLKLAGIIGDSKDSEHAYEIDILNWGWVKPSVYRPKGAFTILKATDKSTPALLGLRYTSSSLASRHIPQGQLTVRRVSSRLEA